MSNYNNFNTSSSSGTGSGSEALHSSSSSSQAKEETFFESFRNGSTISLNLPSPSPFRSANSGKYFPILHHTPAPFRAVTTSSAIPHECFEEFIIHPPYKNKKLDRTGKWGGTIDFRPIPISENKYPLGTPLRACLNLNGDRGLRNPEQPLFQSWADAGKTHIDLMIMWPGYPDLDWVVPISIIYGPDSHLVTRRQMAHRIAIQYQMFALTCELNMLECREPRWRIGRGGYSFDRMRIGQLRWVEGDIWQAVISVITDRDVDPNGLKPMREMLAVP